MGKYSRPEVEYNSEEGFVRLNLRRPVNLYVPSDQQETYDPAVEGDDVAATLELEWVHGYRGRDCRNNLFCLASGEMVYFAASVAVVYNPETGVQRHFTQHSDDIKCLAVHPDGKTVATGQIKGRDDNLPHVCVWDSESLEVLKEFGTETFNRGVNCVAFSKDSGDLLAAVDDAPEPHLSLWRWSDGEMTTECKAASGPVIGVAFSGESPSRIITSGKSHLAFWSMEDDCKDLDKKTGIFGSYEKPKYVTVVSTLSSGDVVTGDSNGNLMVWRQGGNTVHKSVEAAHDGSILHLSVSEDGSVITGGKDGKVIVHNSDLEPTDQTVQIDDQFGSPRCVLLMGDDLFVGTTANAIIKTSFEGEPKVITQGHLEELWGIAAHHSKPQFVTAGQDGRVYCRDASSHELMWSKTLEISCQSADFIPACSHLIAVGGSGGKWVAIEAETQEIVHEGQDGDEIIQVVRFSPDGNKLALGSRDNAIYIYDIEEDGKTFTKKGECEGHSSFITHLDWSSDGAMIRSNSGDYEVLCWKAEDCSLVTQSEDFKDQEWASNNCILSFRSIGIWPPGTDGTHINGCNKANEKPLIASGDDFGLVKLFNYPASTQNGKHHCYHGHSSHVTNVVFLHDDSLLLSAGGRDTTAMQWKVVAAEEE